MVIAVHVTPFRDLRPRDPRDRDPCDTIAPSKTASARAGFVRWGGSLPHYHAAQRDKILRPQY
jgi:hypothetical protein